MLINKLYITVHFMTRIRIRVLFLIRFPKILELIYVNNHFAVVEPRLLNFNEPSNCSKAACFLRRVISINKFPTRFKAFVKNLLVIILSSSSNSLPKYFGATGNLVRNLEQSTRNNREILSSRFSNESVYFLDSAVVVRHENFISH